MTLWAHLSTTANTAANADELQPKHNTTCLLRDNNIINFNRTKLLSFFGGWGVIGGWQLRHRNNTREKKWFQPHPVCHQEQSYNYHHHCCLESIIVLFYFFSQFSIISPVWSILHSCMKIYKVDDLITVVTGSFVLSLKWCNTAIMG